ncbi:LysR family transcriptional regulator [Pectinatus cerevisiiphilus]|uniref:LysR family transcriptional regulator n=1 Tax=Pectinatus cerevisiiphilus TaxID=86956 RepID=A0A4R3K530_9FIRM|nr:LysR family transcriptional regulator [Pectinatus cerevisiiphilus]TCS77771.1 LysR family transcriptional regulator [Pectinatus cerevisiiphilus]
MEIRRLQYFIAVCKYLHFTKAAESLHIAQPTLSQQIQMLEQEVDAQLFDRVGKKVMLTSAGRILFRHSMRIFDTMEQAKTEISQLNGLERGQIKVACFGTYLAMETVIAFHKQYPKIHIELEQLSTGQIRHKLLQNELDFGVVFLPLADKELEAIPLYTEKMIVMAAKNHPFAAKKGIAFAQLGTVPLVMMSEDFIIRRIFDQACQENEFAFTPILELSQMEDLREMVEQNIGISVLPYLYVHSICSHYNICIVPFTDISIERKIGIVYRKGRHMSAAALKLIEKLRVFFAELKLEQAVHENN